MSYGAFRESAEYLLQKGHTEKSLGFAWPVFSWAFLVNMYASGRNATVIAR